MTTPETPTSECDVVRSVELEAPVEDVWRVVSDPTELAGWLADEVELEVAEGGRGRLVEGGRVRRAVVETVEPGRRLAWRWWDEGEGEAGASRVEITLVPTPGPTRVVVREVWAPAPARASSRAAVTAGVAWDVRLCLLAIVPAWLLARV